LPVYEWQAALVARGLRVYTPTIATLSFTGGLVSSLQPVAECWWEPTGILGSAMRENGWLVSRSPSRLDAFSAYELTRGCWACLVRQPMTNCVGRWFLSY